MNSQAADTSRAQLRVVIADDSVVIRERLREFLRELQPVAVVAEAGDAAGTIDAITQHAPDVLILDLFMPGGGGIRVLERLRGAPERPVVIIHTNFPDPEYVKACRRLGAEHFLDKSDDPATLMDLLRSLAGQR
jgi:DNA-binding NarL/FixJ family response regulator